ncbi:MAG: MBL fold metallo-hydrolase [Bacillota bacterium]
MKISLLKKLTTIGICAVMAVSCSPLWAFAAEEGTEPAQNDVEATETGTPENPEAEPSAETDAEEADVTYEDKGLNGVEDPLLSEEEEPEETCKDYGEPIGSLLEDTSQYSKTMRIYGIYLHRSSGTKSSNDRFGDAILIESNGKYLLMDTGSITPIKGSSTVYHSSLVSTLKKIGVKELDVYISHLHQDHTGGLDDICSNFKVNRLYLPDLELCKYYETPSGLSIRSRYVHNLDIAEGRIGELVFLKPSFREHEDIEYNGVVYGKNARIASEFNVGAAVFTVMGPVGTYKVNDFSSQDGVCGTKNGHCLNNCSLTSMIQCGNFKFLAAGDTEKQEETKQVSKYGTALNCDLLKVSHHALSTSSKENYLDKARPMWSFEEDHGFTSSVSTQTTRLKNYGYNYSVAGNKTTLIVDVNNSKVKLIKDTNNNGKADEKAMAGWVSVKGSKQRYQYYNTSGNIATGWMWHNGGLYYLNPESGFRYTGKYKMKGVSVEFNKNGVLTSHKKPAKTTIRSAKALKQHKARIRWSKAKRASAYKVYRSTAKNSGYKCIRTVKSSQRAIQDKGLKRGKTYYYKVCAVRYVAGGTMYGPLTKARKVVAR